MSTPRSPRSRRYRPSLKAPEALEGILDRAGESRFASVRPVIAPKTWREAVGARIAEKAAPVSIYGGVLLLRVPSSVWAHELSLLATDLCQRLRDRGIEVKELRFRVGALPAVDRPPERRSVRSVPVTQPVPSEVEGLLSRIGDDALRAAISRAVGANLAWQTAVRPAPPEHVSEALRAARAPRSAERESARPAPGSPASRGATPGNRGGGSGRPR
jgi:hypothetical protein